MLDEILGVTTLVVFVLWLAFLVVMDGKEGE